MHNFNQATCNTTLVLGCDQTPSREGLEKLEKAETSWGLINFFVGGGGVAYALC